MPASQISGSKSPLYKWTAKKLNSPGSRFTDGQKEFNGKSLPKEFIGTEKGNLQKTSTWFLKYRVGDKPITITTGTQDYQEAVAILQQKIERAAQGCHFDRSKRVLVNQLLDLLIDDYQSKDRDTTYNVEHRVAKQLRPFFGAKEPTEITAALLEQYVASRADRAAPATVNKELAFFKRALRLGYRHEPQLVNEVPAIPKLPVYKNVKRGGLPSEHRNQQRLVESDNGARQNLEVTQNVKKQW